MAGIPNWVFRVLYTIGFALVAFIVLRIFAPSWEIPQTILLIIGWGVAFLLGAELNKGLDEITNRIKRRRQK